MKKVILSLVIIAASLGAKGQTDYTGTGFEYDFSTTCLNNGTYSGAVYINGHGAVSTGVTRITAENALQITSVAADQRTAGYGVDPLYLDLYYVDGANCSSLRGTADYIDMSNSANGKVSIEAKASAPMNLRIELGKTNLTATNQNGQENEMALTTSYATYTFDYNGKWGAFNNTEINLIRFKFNVGDANVSTTGFDGTVNIKSIKIGSKAATASTNEAVVNNSLISVYPNPAKDQINVDLTSMNASSDATVKIMNANGMLVYEGTASNSNETINTASFNKGIYLVQVSAGNKVSNKKIVIE